MTPTVQESVLVAATPVRAYETVSDVSRMGEFSPEATGAEGATSGSLELGARFKGTNRSGRATWATQCRVVAADPGREFAFEVRAVGGPIAVWRYSFLEEPEGVRVTETWEDLRTGLHGRLMSLVAFVLTGVRDRAAHNRSTMRTTLAHLKTDLERQPSGR